jgi:hypothetical protein
MWVRRHPRKPPGSPALWAEEPSIPAHQNFGMDFLRPATSRSQWPSCAATGGVRPRRLALEDKSSAVASAGCSVAVVRSRGASSDYRVTRRLGVRVTRESEEQRAKVPNGHGSMVGYFGVAARVLDAQQHHVRHLIGNVHWGSVGGHREELFRVLLESRLPSRFRVSEGFVAAGDGAVSPQIDVLVWDQQSHGPLLQVGRFVIVPPEAVLGVIEVKSSLAGDNMRDAANNIVAAKRIVRRGRTVPVFGGIFGYRTEASRDHIVNCIRDALGNVTLPELAAFGPDMVVGMDAPAMTAIGFVGPTEIAVYINRVPVLPDPAAEAGDNRTVNLAPEVLLVALLHFGDHFFVRCEPTDQANLAAAPMQVRLMDELQRDFPLVTPAIVGVGPLNEADRERVEVVRRQWEAAMRGAQPAGQR